MRIPGLPPLGEDPETQSPGGMTLGRAPETVLGDVGPARGQAQLALARLRELSVDLRDAAFFHASGWLLASSGDDELWERLGHELIAAAETADRRELSQLHVGGSAGEVFVVRYEGYAVIATAERFALASLFAADLRSVLRDLVEGHAGLDRRAPDPGPDTREEIASG